MRPKTQRHNKTSTKRSQSDHLLATAYLYRIIFQRSKTIKRCSWCAFCSFNAVEMFRKQTSQTNPSVIVSAKRASNFLHRPPICAGYVSTAGMQVESPSWLLLTHCLISPAIMLSDRRTKPDTKHNKALLLCNQRQLGEQRRGRPSRRGSTL